MIARAGSFLRTLLGESCIACGIQTDQGALCGPCQFDLPRLTAPLCSICAEPVASAIFCGRCLRRPPHYDHVVAAGEYAFPLDAMLHRLKYQGDLSIARALGALLGDAVVYTELPDFIIPMPLTRARMRQRGFNQAIELVRGFPKAIRTRGRVLHALERVRDTPSQTGVRLQERMKNLRNAFRASARFDGARIAIVDDVLTTGATLNDAARALKVAGAIEVTGWVVARTVARDRL